MSRVATPWAAEALPGYCDLREVPARLGCSIEHARRLCVGRRIEWMRSTQAMANRRYQVLVSVASVDRYRQERTALAATKEEA